MRLHQRLMEAGRRLDRTAYSRSGLERLGRRVPPGVRRVGGRYGPPVAILLAIVLFASALSGSNPSGVNTAGTQAEEIRPGDETQDQVQLDAGPLSTEAPGTAKAIAKAREIAKQVAAPPTANVCGKDGIVDTGTFVQYPYARQCLPPFSGDNLGAPYRGVYRDKIRVALYVTRDPTVLSTTAAVQGCTDEECFIDWTKAFVEWFSKYYLTYGRAVEIVPVRGSGSEDNVDLAIADARTVRDINPPVFASLNGPAAYAKELKASGILCFCTTSLAQELYEHELAPYVWATLMANTQRYIHAAQYIGERLAGRNAIYAGDAATKARKREFSLVWFDNTQGDYKSGIDFFERLLKEKYKVTLNEKIRSEGLQGCQQNAANIGIQLANSKATSVIVATDPICPISLTRQMEAQQAKWEYILTGSALTDVNTLARLYDRNQWSRAFGVSALEPSVKDQNRYIYKMFKEVRPNGQWYVNIPLYLGPVANFFTGVHLAGAKLNQFTFRDGMAKAIPRGGTVTLPKCSFGPKSLPAFGFNFWDYTCYDDTTEIWWDNTAKDANGTERAYRYVDAGKRHVWGTWPSTDVKAFNPEGTITGYDKAPDQ